MSKLRWHTPGHGRPLGPTTSMSHEHDRMGRDAASRWLAKHDKRPQPSQEGLDGYVTGNRNGNRDIPKLKGHGKQRHWVFTEQPRNAHRGSVSKWEATENDPAARERLRAIQQQLSGYGRDCDEVGTVMKALNCKASTAKKILRGKSRPGEHNRRHGLARLRKLEQARKGRKQS